MHGTYSFALHYQELSKLSDDELRLAAETDLESYMEKHSDENNWFVCFRVIAVDGRCLRFPEMGQKTPPTEDSPMTFEQARRMALDCIAIDMKLCGASSYGIAELFGGKDPGKEKIEQMSFGDVLAAIDAEVPKLLAEAYQKIVGKPKSVGGGPDVFMDEYSRQSLVRQFELLRSANYPPFVSNLQTPYDFRAYDLTNGSGEPNAILQVDIHT